MTTMRLPGITDVKWRRYDVTVCFGSWKRSFFQSMLKRRRSQRMRPEGTPVPLFPIELRQLTCCTLKSLDFDSFSLSLSPLIYIYIYIYWSAQSISTLTHTLSLSLSIYIYIYICIFAQWASEYNVHQWSLRPGFNPRSSHTKDSKMILDAALLNTQHYNVRIMGKVEQSRERNNDLSYTLV